MRERERLEDFRGGHVACRGCKRLIYFAPEGMQTQGQSTPVLCCGIAYVPSRHQVDLMIYDRLHPDEVAELGAEVMPTPGPVHVQATEDMLGYLDTHELPGLGEEEDAAVSDVDLDGMVATAAQIAERAPERKTALHRRLHGNA